MSYYESHPCAGPKGYLEPYAVLGAVKIKQTVDALQYSSSLAGQIWQLDALTRQIVNGAVVGVHNCSRCGLQREGPSRSVTEMERRLSWLWKPSAGKEDCRS
jgi:hypothetical protein